MVEEGGLLLEALISGIQISSWVIEKKLEEVCLGRIPEVGIDPYRGGTMGALRLVWITLSSLNDLFIWILIVAS